MTIKVHANSTFWERHPEHPNGELFLSQGQEEYVVETRGVSTAINDGRLSPVTDVVSLNDVELPKSAREALLAADYRYLHELTGLSDEELLAVDGIGKKSLEIIREVINDASAA